ncbi:hypothetical protein [Candidatus Pelagisphaera phototrophica]|uniref:hypothetical protein n=1 Tax=Candidatus Pelagisphaera phototrophica TaxID=2684113 RepID=UPI0024B8336A|nr:hypothetical protein [Candidatus Pelagisphaera phototrophica]QXD31330.1 hypothetical protein GA004_13480 [Candidatus Pelagisphaera phototrophica]
MFSARYKFLDKLLDGAVPSVNAEYFEENIMKKILSLFFILNCFILHGDDHDPAASEVDERMIYVVRYIEVAKSDVVAYEAALAEKTQRFNVGEGTDEWFTHKILTGPRTGQYARWFGPVPWSDLDRTETTHRVGVGTPADAARMSNPEVAFWQKHLTPLEINSGETEILEQVPGSDYRNLDIDHPRFGFAQRWKIKPGMVIRKEAYLLQFARVMKSSGFSLNGEASRLVSGGDYMIFESWIGFNEWAEIGKFRSKGFSAVFNKALGEEGFEKFLAEFALIHQDSPTETSVWEFLPALSSRAH